MTTAFCFAGYSGEGRETEPPISIRVVWNAWSFSYTSSWRGAHTEERFLTLPKEQVERLSLVCEARPSFDDGRIVKVVCLSSQ